MKKLLLGTVLCLAAAVSVAFYPKASSNNGQYLFLISDINLDPSPQYTASLTTIEPDGAFHTEELPNNTYSDATKETVTATISASSAKDAYVYQRARYARNLLLQREIRKVNELTAQGWVLVATAPDKFGVRYVFHKSTP